MANTDFFTVGALAEKLNCPIHRIQYLITARRIDPVQRIGGYRLFSPDVLKQLRDEIDNKKGAVAHAN